MFLAFFLELDLNLDFPEIFHEILFFEVLGLLEIRNGAFMRFKIEIQTLVQVVGLFHIFGPL